MSFYYNRKVKVGHEILGHVPPLPWAGCVLCETLVRPPARVTSVPQRDPQTEKIWRRKGQMFKMQKEPTYKKDVNF